MHPVRRIIVVMYKWKVCPIQGRQLKDVREEDLFGDFRLCNTYRGGGGYDQFPKICSKRFGIPEKGLGNQFVVQLFGCPLDCPYCYVTRDGVFGKVVRYTSEELVGRFRRSGAHVFHLMGGAPAIYLDRWKEIVELLDDGEIFHSDFLLAEKHYKLEWLIPLVKRNVLIAVDIKGVTPEDFEKNTNRPFYEKFFWYNFDMVVASGINFYLTFTNPDLSYIEEFKEDLVRKYGKKVLEDSFIIDLIDYEALK